MKDLYDKLHEIRHKIGELEALFVNYECKFKELEIREATQKANEQTANEEK